MKKFSITTKTGDKGLTGLFSGEKVLKNNPRLEAYGDLDELVSLLGICRHHLKDKSLQDEILSLQRDLFVIGSELATTRKGLTRLPRRLDQKMFEEFEKKRLSLEEKVETPKDFVVPGKTLPSAYFDLARAVCRRCERKVAGLISTKEIENELILVWLNRLSDYLYLVARLQEGQYQMVKENIKD